MQFIFMCVSGGDQVTQSHTWRMRPMDTALRALMLAGFAATPAALAGPAAAETPAPAPYPAIEEIVVTSDPLRRSAFDSLQATSVLDGAALDEQMAPTLGAALDGLPGVAQSSFVPGASRPILRGLGGDRIRVLVNGIGTFDASTTSPDHAVAVDMAHADRVEVVRGPATLIYGNNAVGGVVNVFDGRLPTEIPEGGLSFGGRASYASNGDGTEISGRSTAGLGDRVAIHAEGFHRQAGDISIPGFLRSEALRAADPLPDDLEYEGVAPNSDLRQSGGALGASWIGERGFLGASVSFFDKDYGLPVVEGAAPQVRIDQEQIRVDVAGNYRVERPWLEEVRLRVGYADYEHSELDGGEIATTFYNEGVEARVELTHAAGDWLSGAAGVQVRHRDFSAVGAEAFVPPNTTRQVGVFLVEQADFGRLSVGGGLRFERQDADTDDNTIQTGFNAVSASVGLGYDLTDGLRLTGNAFRTERAPNAEELFSDGPHVATFTYEVGDPALDKEVALGGEVALRKDSGRLTGALTGYYTDYDRFITELFTGEERLGLPVAQFAAFDSRFYGFEVEGDLEVAQWAGHVFSLNTVIDYVRAEFTAVDGNVPRIPPLTAQVGGAVEGERWRFGLTVEVADEQDKVGPNENAVDGYTKLDASLRVRPFDDRPLSLLFEANNLTNDEIRYAASFLRDRVPAMGRNFQVSAVIDF
ncbi:hypothetical protein CCR80_01635 [Rhodothalassium salexigens]|nr:hypothetical protein [Rhodothalassium salexigens]